MIATERGTTTQMEGCPAIGVTQNRKVFQFLIKVESSPFVIIDELDALNHLIVELFYESLCSEMTKIVKVMRGDASEVFN